MPENAMCPIVIVQRTCGGRHAPGCIGVYAHMRALNFAAPCSSVERGATNALSLIAIQTHSPNNHTHAKT